MTIFHNPLGGDAVERAIASASQIIERLDRIADLLRALERVEAALVDVRATIESIRDDAPDAAGVREGWD